MFQLITKLVKWENITDEDVLGPARAEIRASWKETCEVNKNHPDAKTLFNPEKLPAFHDPFAGGGTIPLEAQRLGLEAHGTDLNPVAVLINKAMIEIPPKFAGRPPVGPVPEGRKQTRAKATEQWSGPQGLAEDVRRYGAWMCREAERRIGNLYPKVTITKELVKSRKDLKQYEGAELTVIAWLWARTVKSPNPAFSDVDVPLASSFLLGMKPGKEAWVQPVISGRGYQFKVRTGIPPADVNEGTKIERSSFKCLFSGAPITGEYIREEAQAGRLGTRLMAVVAEGSGSRVYLTPTREIEAAANLAVPEWKPDLEFFQQALGFRVGNYGFTRWSHLFTQRQLVTLSTLAGLAREAREHVKTHAIASGMLDDGISLAAGGQAATAYADAIAVYLAMGISRYANASTSLCSWNPGASKEDIRFTFSRHALSMTWDFAEGNPFSDSSGNIADGFETWLYKSILFLPAIGAGVVEQADASTQNVSQAKFVSSDPPYYDNIGYADLSDFFYVWLRRALSPVFPALFATLAVPKAEELVATPHRHGGKDRAEAHHDLLRVQTVG